MNKTLTLLLLLTALALVNGCGPWKLTECREMTDGGPTGRNFDEWQKSDEIARSDFKPQLKRWWEGEKKRWPIFKRTCLNAADCYASSLEAEEIHGK